MSDWLKLGALFLGAGLVVPILMFAVGEYGMWLFDILGSPLGR